MKKILATVLALTMIVCMSITAFAAYTEKQTLDALNEKVEITINGTYSKAPVHTDETPVYSVDIEWNAISFAFTESANIKTWVPEHLAYEVTQTNSTGSWSGEDATIQITNSSNAGIVVTPTYVKATGGAEVVVSGAVTLASAVGAGEAGANAATTGTITVSKPTTGTISDNGALGTLTLTITAA